MTSTVRVAPREIIDVVYRATRVNGADSGEASLIGRAVAFAQIQTGGGVARVNNLLSEDEVPPVGFMAIAELEVDTRRSNRGRGEMPPDMAVADLAAAAFDLGQRGVVVTMVCADERSYSPHAWLSIGKSDLGVVELIGEIGTVDQGVASRVVERAAIASHDGVVVDSHVWSDLTRLAHGYLVPEATIDAAAP